MTIREIFEEKEYKELSAYASHSRSQKAVRDRKQNVTSGPSIRGTVTGFCIPKAFRRLKDKTQVFLCASRGIITGPG